MPYSLFHIPKTMIKRSIYSPNRKFKWEEYDQCCKRCTIKIPFNIIKKIYNLTNLSYPIKNNNSTYHYIKYNINNNYTIAKHNDACKCTIIIYLNKNKSIKENFYIENNNVGNNLWSQNDNTYGCLVMWSENDNSGLEHYGDMIGNGDREILCLFLD